MCGGGGGTTSNSQTIYSSSNLPAWVTDEAKTNYGMVKDISDRPYDTYGGARIADFTTDELGAMDLTRSLTGNYGPMMEIAGTTAGQMATETFPQADVAAYMSPYTQNVIDASVAEMNRQGSIDRERIERNMHMAGGYGSARHGVVESEQMRNQGDAIARMVAGLNADAFSNAQAQYNTDAARRLQGSQVAAELAGLGQQYGYNDVNALMQIGGMERGLTNEQLALGYTDWQRQQDYPIEMLNLRMAGLNATPYNTTSMTQTDTMGPSSNPNSASQWAGLALAGLGAGGYLWG